jgi:tetratricopeptide (TPR) repeat protein
VQAVVQRRLERVPMEAQFLLALAAAAGRQLDLRLLAQLAPETDLEHWLLTCTNVAVLEIRDDAWRFAHEKLREGVLSALPPGARAVLHRQVAQAIERVYAGEPDQAATLIYQWRMAGEQAQERRYARLAGEHALEQYSNDDARTYLTRALELTPAADLDERYQLLLAREQVLNRQGDRQVQAADLADLAQLAHALADPHKQAQVALRQANYAEATGDYAAAIAASQDAINLAHDAGDAAFEVDGYIQWGYVLWREGQYALAQQRLERALELSAEGTQLRATVLRNVGTAFYYQSDYARAKSYYERSLDLCRQLGDQRGEGGALSNLGLVMKELGDYARAKDYYEQALHISREQGDRRLEAQYLNNLGIVVKGLGDYVGARACYEQALQIRQEIGDRQGLGSTLINQGNVSKFLGHYAEAEAFYAQALRICREVGDRWNEGLALNNLSRIYHLMGDDERAQIYLQQALPIVQDIGDRRLESETWQIQGDILTSLGQFDQAVVVCWQNLALRRELGQAHLALVPLRTLAHISLAQAELSQAQAQVEEILEHLLDKTLDALDESLQIYLTCYRVLQATQDPRARDVLAAAHALLQERAAKIGDEDLRRSFLENVAEHCDIGRAYERVFGPGA